VRVIELGLASGVGPKAPEMEELWIVSELLNEDVDAQISEERWREVMETLQHAGHGGGLPDSGTIGGTENSSNATPSATAANNNIIANTGTTNTVPNTDAANNSAVEEISPSPGELYYCNNI
jgi:hypothetical protein